MRTLVLSLGNSSLLGGIVEQGRVVARVRAPVRRAATRAGFARWVTARLKGPVDRAALCSVVPVLTGRVVAAVQRAYGLAPRILEPAAPHGLAIDYRRPGELGADRLAAALGARARWPRRNCLVIDFGTATTVTAITARGRVAGGAILPGYGLWGEVLAARTAQLPQVGGRRPLQALGRSTREGIASGLHFGHAGAVRELALRIGREAFGRARPLVVATGGNAGRFASENLFAHSEPDLILLGLHAFAHA